MSKWSAQHVKQLLRDGKVVAAKIPERNKNFSSNGKPVVIPREKPKAIGWLDLNLQYWCNKRAFTLNCSANGSELQFDTERKFRFDYAIPAVMIAIEYEGGVFMQRGGHNSVAGIHRDIEKYQLAQKLGWRVIRVTALTYTTVLKTLNDLVK